MIEPQRPKELRLLPLAWPIFVEQGLRVLMATVDMFMVSHISDGAVAAVSVSMQVVLLSIILFSFISIGAGVVITHHLGAGDRAGADGLTRAAIGVNTWVGLFVSCGVALTALPILTLMRLPESLLSYAVPFLTLMGGTLFIEAQNIACAAALRAHGHTRAVMLVLVGQNVVHVIGNALLLFGLLGFPALGVVGVAVSGIFSRAVCLVALRVLLRRVTGIRIGVTDLFRFSMPQLRRILRIGLPGAGEHLSYWLAFMVVTTFVASLGETNLAAFSYVRQIQFWVVLFVMALGLGTEILIGHLIGSGDYDRVERELPRILRTGFIIAIGGTALLSLLAPVLFGIFTDDAAVVALGVPLIWMGLLLEPGRVFNLVVINALRATGDARFPLFIGLLSMWGVWIPLAWFFGIWLGWGLPGIWLAMICDEWLRGSSMLYRWKSRAWLAHAERSRAHVATA